jgi:hypothetical protein
LLLLKFALGKDREGRTDLLLGASATTTVAEHYQPRYDFDAGVLSSTVTSTEQQLSLELGLGYTIGMGHTAPIFVEAAWTPGSVTRSQTEEVRYLSSANRPNSKETVDTDNFEVSQGRLAIGLILGHFESYGMLRYLHGSDGVDSVAFGVGGGFFF